MLWLRQSLTFLKILFTPRSDIILENIALRHQLVVLLRKSKRPRLLWQDRVFWVWLSRLCQGWRASLLIVRPDTVVRWHRQGWRLYWRKKSRGNLGRPRIDTEIRELVRCMARENPLWGAPRIHGELLKLGFVVAESSVAKYMPERAKPPSATWRTFLMNHGLDAWDFFTVPTLTFGLLYVFVALRHRDRQFLHARVTPHPTAAWTAQQIRETFPFDESPRHILRDNYSVYGADFSRAAPNLGIKEVRTAKGSPWQNPFVERVVGSIRLECTDHVIPLGQRHLQRVLNSYQCYYNGSRCHLGLRKDTPESREVEPPEMGDEFVAICHLGGLHHRYTRRAAWRAGQYALYGSSLSLPGAVALRPAYAA